MIAGTQIRERKFWYASSCPRGLVNNGSSRFAPVRPVSVMCYAMTLTCSWVKMMLRLDAEDLVASTTSPSGVS